MKKNILPFNCNKSITNNDNPSNLRNKKKSDWNSISFIFILVFLSGLILFLNRCFDVFNLKENSLQIVYEILLILIVSSALSSGKIRQNLKYLSIWAGIFLVLLTGYSFRHELSEIKDRLLMEIIPSKGLQRNPNSISFPVSSDGHFYIRARVNGIPVMFLADTGASHIVLSPGDAKKLGIEIDKLTFDRFYETANGNVSGSSVRIADFRIGNIHLKEIGASVNKAEMRNSLLGMTFFRRLNRYEVKDDVLTLYWR